MTRSPICGLSTLRTGGSATRCFVVAWGALLARRERGVITRRFMFAGVIELYGGCRELPGERQRKLCHVRSVSRDSQPLVRACLLHYDKRRLPTDALEERLHRERTIAVHPHGLTGPGGNPQILGPTKF